MCTASDNFVKLVILNYSLFYKYKLENFTKLTPLRIGIGNKIGNILNGYR